MRPRATYQWSFYGQQYDHPLNTLRIHPQKTTPRNIPRKHPQSRGPEGQPLLLRVILTEKSTFAKFTPTQRCHAVSEFWPKPIVGRRSRSAYPSLFSRFGLGYERFMDAKTPRQDAQSMKSVSLNPVTPETKIRISATPS